MTPSPRREQTVLVHALSGATSFTACLQLFRRYPLAVTPHSADSGYRSMVLMNRDAGLADFFILTQAPGDHFVIRSWKSRDGVTQEIRPSEPVSGIIDQVLGGSMPVPRDGALLGWVTDSQVTVMLAVHCRLPETWDAPVPVPEIWVMPMAGTSELLHWPPFTASPLDDGRLWEYVERGQIVDVVPLVTQRPGRAFWVPSPGGRSARHEKGCVVVTNHLPADDYWLPAGVYLDHWTLREGIQAPPVSHLLALPGVVDLAHRLR
jgi:hypothetical protein